MVRTRVEVIGVPVDVVDWHAALARMSEWAHSRQSRYVCLTNVHSVVTAARDAEFHAALRRADLCAPDGAPVAWMLRQLGAQGQKRLNGPDLMLRQLSAASAGGGKVYLYGGTPETLAACDVTVQIPMRGFKNTINVATAFGIILYEILRQWRSV